jgi:hypothetical protein
MLKRTDSAIGNVVSLAPLMILILSTLIFYYSFISAIVPFWVTISLAWFIYAPNILFTYGPSFRFDTGFIVTALIVSVLPTSIMWFGIVSQRLRNKKT